MSTSTPLLVVGRCKIALMPDELPIIVRGEIPPDFAEKLARFSLNLPKRGTVAYHLEFRDGSGRQLTVPLYCRRAQRAA